MIEFCVQTTLMLGTLLLSEKIHMEKVLFLVTGVSPFTPDNAKCKIDKTTKITNCIELKTKEHHSKVC